MYIERNVFHLRFGATKQALLMWKEFLKKVSGAQQPFQVRLLTDLTGRGYTLVMELSYSTYAELEPSKCGLSQIEGWTDFYSKFIPLCEYSERTLYKLEATS